MRELFIIRRGFCCKCLHKDIDQIERDPGLCRNPLLLLVTATIIELGGNQPVNVGVQSVFTESHFY